MIDYWLQIVFTRMTRRETDVRMWTGDKFWLLIDDFWLRILLIGLMSAGGRGRGVLLINDVRLMITDCPWLLCEPNEKEGRKLWGEIMKGGNFGQYDTRDAELKRGGMVKHGVWKLKRVMRLVRSYPEEALCEPVFRVWHLGWRMIHG